MGMPLGRYFAFIGSMLLALLFLADWYLPQPAAMPARTDVDRTVIRLHSSHKWPERIVIDTSLPTIVPPAARVAETLPVKPPPAARTPGDALAMATPAEIAAPAIARNLFRGIEQGWSVPVDASPVSRRRSSARPFR